MMTLYARLEPTTDRAAIQYAADQLNEPDFMDVALYAKREARVRIARFPYYFDSSKPKPEHRSVELNCVRYHLKWLKPLADNRRQLTFA